MSWKGIAVTVVKEAGLRVELKAAGHCLQHCMDYILLHQPIHIPCV
jgi:hypothetical protein